MRTPASWTLNGGTISGGTVSASGGAQLVSGSQLSILDGATFSANLAISNGSFISVQNGLTLVGGATVTLGSAGSNSILSIKSGSQTIGGAGEIVMAGTQSTNYLNVGDNIGATTLTVGAGITVRGRGHIQHGSGGLVSTLINQGTIQADVSGQTLDITTSTFTNNGTIKTAQRRDPHPEHHHPRRRARLV